MTETDFTKIAEMLINQITEYGKGNFEYRNKLSNDNDYIDALAKGLNMLGEELSLKNEDIQRSNTQLIEGKQQLEKANEEITVLLKEMHHRVKNNLQIISSLLNLQSRKIDDDRLLGVFNESQYRIRSISLIHERLYQHSELSNINVEEYLFQLMNELLITYGIGHQITSIVQCDDIYLDIDKMVSLGLLMNELISNSLKHAFVQRDRGTIKIEMNRKEDCYELVYSDDGVGFVDAIDLDNTTSLGFTIIYSLIEQLDGKIRVTSSNKGTIFYLEF